MQSIRKRLTVTGEKLFLCDMRPGFSEDGVEVPLPKGDYQLFLEPTLTDKLRGFSLTLAGQTPDTELAKGTFRIDMARVGVFDRKAFLKVFSGDGEDLFDWSQEASDKKEAGWGGFLKHKQSGLEALYVNIGSDCECSVQLLRFRSRSVGVRVVPKALPARAADELGSRHWTWVELKCPGIGDCWSFCDDRDYKCDFGLVLDNVLFEVKCLYGDALGAKIDADKAISFYTPRFKGVSKIGMFYERADEPRRRLPISLQNVPKLGSEATPRNIAKVVFDLFKHARRLT